MLFEMSIGFDLLVVLTILLVLIELGKFGFHFARLADYYKVCFDMLYQRCLLFIIVLINLSLFNVAGFLSLEGCLGILSWMEIFFSIFFQLKNFLINEYYLIFL